MNLIEELKIYFSTIYSDVSIYKPKSKQTQLSTSAWYLDIKHHGRYVVLVWHATYPGCTLTAIKPKDYYPPISFHNKDDLKKSVIRILGLTTEFL